MLSTEIREYEQSDVWRWRAELFVLAHGNWCDACGTTGGRRVVDVHHRTYERAFDGREPDSDLRALCRWHHDLVHQYTGAVESRYGFGKLAFATDLIIAEARGLPGYGGPAMVGPSRSVPGSGKRLRRTLLAAAVVLLAIGSGASSTTVSADSVSALANWNSP